MICSKLTKANLPTTITSHDGHPPGQARGVKVETKKLARIDEEEDTPDFTVLEIPSGESKTPSALGALKSASMSLSMIRSNPSLLSGLTAESLTVVRGFFFPSHTVFQLNLGTVQAVSTDSSGNWGGAVAGTTFPVANLNTAAEWSSMQALFDEVFVERMRLDWMPHNRYTQYNLQASAVSGAKYSVGVGFVSLHHGAATYTSFATCLVNPTLKLGYAGDPFTYEWVNIEKMTPQGYSGSVSGTAVVGQGWCNTNSTTFAAYSGTVQSIGCVAMGGYTTTVELGRMAIRYRLHFRNRA